MRRLCGAAAKYSRPPGGSRSFDQSTCHAIRRRRSPWPQEQYRTPRAIQRSAQKPRRASARDPHEGLGRPYTQGAPFRGLSARRSRIPAARCRTGYTGSYFDRKALQLDLVLGIDDLIECGAAVFFDHAACRRISRITRQQYARQWSSPPAEQTVPPDGRGRSGSLR